MASDPVTVISKLDTKLMDLNINAMMKSTRFLCCDPDMHTQTDFL